MDLLKKKHTKRFNQNMENKELVKIWNKAWDETITIMKDNRMKIASEEKPPITEQQYYEELGLLKGNIEGYCIQILSSLRPDELLYEEMTICITFLKGKISLYYSLLLKSSINSPRTTRISKKLIKAQRLLYALFNTLRKIQEKVIKIQEREIENLQEK